jgi:hypothetical protein
VLNQQKREKPGGPGADRPPRSLSFRCQKTAEHVRGGGKGIPPEAITLNGFGGHFLTDAFSASHIMAKQTITD